MRPAASRPRSIPAVRIAVLSHSYERDWSPHGIRETQRALHAASEHIIDNHYLEFESASPLCAVAQNTLIRPQEALLY